MEKAVVEDRNRNVTEEYPVLRYRTEVVEREKVSGLVVFQNYHKLFKLVIILFRSAASWA